MASSVWLIADKATSEVSYICHGKEGDEPNWRWIGPFAFTNKSAAETAIKARKFLPLGIRGTFAPLEVDTASFIQAVYNGFPPKHSDVFVLDEALLPLTAGGGAWIDDANGTPIWAELFDEDGDGVGLDWLDRVLGVVATMLGMSMETVQAIGTLNAADEDSAEIEQTRSLIRQHVRVILIPEPGTIQIGVPTSCTHRVTSAALFWLHTSGLVKLGLPELEIRNVPVWWVTAAGEELLNWAAHSIDQGILEGDVLQGGGPVPLDIRVTTSPDPTWQGRSPSCLRLEVVGAVFVSDKSDESPVNRWPSMKVLH